MIKELIYYSNNNWGLCIPTLNKIIEIVKNNNIKTILEFGSGKSTEFLIDLRNELNLDYKIDSFDNSEVYCYNGEKYDFLNLYVTDLIVCQDNDYTKMFETKVFDRSKFKKIEGEFDANVRNATYDLTSIELRDMYDLIIVDGPNGNGRNFSNFYIKDRIKNGTYVILDDYFHYDFVEKLSEFFNCEVIESQIFEGYVNKGHSIIKLINTK